MSDLTPWAVGTYHPSPKFRAIPAMACVYRDDAARTVVATTGPAGDPESVADARLMAASRDLLAACRRMLAHPTCVVAFLVTQAAVAKATGADESPDA